MPPKKISLQDAMRPQPTSPPAKSPASSAANERIDGATSTDQRSRQGKKAISGWFDPQVAVQLQEVALEKTKKEGRKILIQDVMAEAYNDLFAKYQLPEIA